MNSNTLYNDYLFNLRYDILIKDLNNKSLFILDTKYKETYNVLDNNIKEKINKSISSSDIYQIITYSIKEKVEYVYLIYPLYIEGILDDDTPRLIYNLEDNKSINIYILRVPFICSDDIKERLKSI